MKQKETIAVDVKDLYQLLICEMRYAMTRNNHLMPGGAFDHCKKYLMLMKKVSPDFAYSTARQIVEEIIFETPLMDFPATLDLEDDYCEFIVWVGKFLKPLRKFTRFGEKELPEFATDFKNKLKINDKYLKGGK